MKETFHILPLNDLKPHTERGQYCKCEPVIDDRENGILVIHNAYDGREFSEVDFEATVKAYGNSTNGN